MTQLDGLRGIISGLPAVQSHPSPMGTNIYCTPYPAKWGKHISSLTQKNFAIVILITLKFSVIGCVFCVFIIIVN